MRMQKRIFRIGELASNLEVEKFVVRFWEKEFGLATTRSVGGQRFYNESDLATFKLIKQLLYEKGFTIAGAKKVMAENKQKNELTVRASQKTNMQEVDSLPNPGDGVSKEVLLAYKQKLIKIRELLT